MLRISPFLVFILLHMHAAHAAKDKPVRQEISTKSTQFKTLQKKDFFVKIRGGLHKLSVTNGPNDSPKQDARGIGELSLSYFVLDMLAVEMSAGYTPYFLDNKFNTLPLTLTAQFHLPIHARFIPYVGAGYSYRFIFYNSSTQRIKDAGNIAFQAGIDLFPFDDDIALNLDVKYVPKLKHDMSNMRAMTTTKTKISDLSIMAGVGVRF